MARVIGLRSPHAKVGRIVLFGRVLDKIRLHERKTLPAEYRDNLGGSRPGLFDGRCCRFLGVAYDELRARTLEGGCDEEILSWAHARGTRRDDEECIAWNRYVTKMGWRDDRSEILQKRIAEHGYAPAHIETQFELVDVDEGRPPGATRSWESHPLSVVIVMGVSGCGKTTVARALAAALGWEFLEADELHPAANVAKLSAGTALTDSDRAPWIEAVRAAIVSRVARGAKVVAACSALKEAHRLVLAPDPADTRFVHLRGDFALISARLAGRSGHFMKETLLRSQFADLEEPADALTVDTALATDVVVQRIREVLALP
jgi:carbohydrate kinase (thermoresistant glucokinase family)